ncbi:universal stress protein [Rhizobium sp. Root1204]|uniref:universal stress protein n=1 Tax=Rhizobium sp. Root1204 TaxID=1736428 RepID=UPI00071616A9|nr:universal stress protein [Rhizobium sp. Root1204]KQV36658.1 universal stress protein [Rhizobium sp. Root1204]
MPFKTILSVTGATTIDDDLRVATDLCRQVGAHLSALVIARAPTGRYATLSPGWLEERDQNLQALDACAKRVREKLARNELSFDVGSLYVEVAGPNFDIGERAHYADLVLVGPSVFRDSDLKQQVMDGCLFQAGRPLLIAPPGSTSTLQPKTILLAWDSRQSSAHAAQQALELMVNARSVHVTMVDPNAAPWASGEEPGADVAAYLARHRINVTVDILPSAGRSVAQVLQQHAVDVAADVIVMGAYGHSRLREFIVGGVTRSMLAEARLPILMGR